MNAFLNDMAEILEVDEVQFDDCLADFECWDSLTVLSIIAYLDQKYSIKKSALEIKSCTTINDINQLIDNAN